MTAYAGGSRPTEISQHKTFPLADSGAMASFYGRQKGATRPKQELDPTIVVKGEKIYNNRCIDCHADGGRESDKDAPLVAGQNREFMVEQALLFKRGKRKFPFMMDDSYRGLSDEDLAAVAEYFAAQEQFSPQGGKKKKHK